MSFLALFVSMDPIPVHYGTSVPTDVGTGVMYPCKKELVRLLLFNDHFKFLFSSL